jgi:hypothetical protein
LKPDATDVWRDSLGPFGEPRSETELKPEEPRATTQIIFVQFVDGSIWGDPAKADDAFRDRVLTENELKLLIETYRTEGKEQFFTELMKPTRLAAIGTLQRLYADTKDTDRVSTKAVSMLKIAELHRRNQEAPASDSTAQEPKKSAGFEGIDYAARDEAVTLRHGPCSGTKF